jgi:hypothetical protein
MIILWAMLGAGVTSLAYELLGARHARFVPRSTRVEVRCDRVWLVMSGNDGNEVALEYTVDAATEVGRALVAQADEVRR